MNPKKQIMEYIKQKMGERMAAGQSDEDIRRIMDGMSTGTAMIVIEKEMDDQVTGDYEISELENAGRYYLAKIVLNNGSLIKRLLVDKQTGIVRLV